MGTGYTALCILVIDFFIRYDSLKVLPMQWLSWISFPRYAIQGMAFEEYNNVNFTRPGSIVTGLPGILLNMLPFMRCMGSLAFALSPAHAQICNVVANRYLAIQQHVASPGVTLLMLAKLDPLGYIVCAEAAVHCGRWVNIWPVR